MKTGFVIAAAALVSAQRPPHPHPTPSPTPYVPTPTPSYPVPPVMTENQKTTFAEKAQAAKSASQAATPLVLEFFGAQAFRAALQDCCPELANMTPEQLLERYREEAKVAELAHSFPSVPGESEFTDITLETAKDYPWFLNEWQAKILSGAHVSTHGPQIDVEEKIFDCAPFAGQAPAWDEAMDRIIYVAHNMRRVDTGSSPKFGDVTAIFRRSYVKEMTLIAPMDTGYWSMQCGWEVDRHTEITHNCSAWDPLTLGTLDDFDHLILPNLWFWTNTSVTKKTVYDRAQDLFARSAISTASYDTIPKLTSALLYWESDIMGNPALPDGVKFLIGNFKSLWGTASGRTLQDLAAYWGWPLVWALADANSTNTGSRLTFPGNHRVLDPANAKNLTNVTASSDALDAFEEVWTAAEKARSFGAPTTSQFGEWWASLEESQTQVAPLGARSCMSLDDCVGTVLHSGECVCYGATSKIQVL